MLSKSTILQILALLPVSSRASRVIDMKAKNIYFFPFVCQCNSSIDQYTLQENGQGKKGSNFIILFLSFICIPIPYNICLLTKVKDQIKILLFVYHTHPEFHCIYSKTNSFKIMSGGLRTLLLVIVVV